MDKESFEKKSKELKSINFKFTCPNCSSKFLDVIEKEQIDKEYFLSSEAEQRCILECLDCKSHFVSVY